MSSQRISRQPSSARPPYIYWRSCGGWNHIVMEGSLISGQLQSRAMAFISHIGIQIVLCSKQWNKILLGQVSAQPCKWFTLVLEAAIPSEAYVVWNQACITACFLLVSAFSSVQEDSAAENTWASYESYEFRSQLLACVKSAAWPMPNRFVLIGH